MISPDVNVLVYAWNPHTPEHEQAHRWLGQHLSATEPFGVSELVLSGALRILTMPRVRQLGYEPGVVMTLVDELLTAPGVVRIRPGAKHWAIFRRLCADTGAWGNTVADCYHAALAMEHDAT